MVSVVVPFYNAEAYLAEALESVVGQSYTDWELLLVDDASTDRSASIVHGFAQADRRIRYVKGGNANRGISATRNVGLRLARGELVAVLDADDVWFPEKLEEQVALLAARPAAALLFGRSEYWYSWAEQGGSVDFVPDFGVEAGRIFEPPELLLCLYPLGAGNAPSPSSVIFRRALLKVTGGFEEQVSNAYDDQGFLTKAYSAAPVLVVDRVWDRYRQHEASVSAQVEQLDEYWSLRLAFLRWLKSYLASRGPVDERVARALDAALFLAGDPNSPPPPVTGVEQVVVEPGPELAGASVEVPAVGRLTVSDLLVSGWVVGRSVPASRVRVEQEGRLLGEIAVDRTRSDLDGTNSIPAGFIGTVEGFMLTPGRLEVRAVLQDGSLCDMASIFLRGDDPGHVIDDL